jgi:heat-inducible transcriptional repressor
MTDLTERQKKILMLVVRDHIETAQPVGSQRIVEHFHLDMSSATVRNELAVLTEQGFLRQPADLPESVQHTISHQFYQARQDIDQWMTLAASILAHQSQGVSVVTAPHADRARFKHVELISTQGRQVLMVLVMSDGDVDQQILTLAEPVPQEMLSATANRLNQQISGKTLDELASLPMHSNALEQDILTIITTDMRRTDARVSGEMYVDGLTNVLSEPEFTDSDNARRALRMFEERSTLQDLLARTVMNSGVGGVQVLIGGDGTWDELRQCSMVLARYGVPGMATGTLGVLGPMRMSYARAIPTVRNVAGLLSDLVNENIGGE